MFRSSCQAVLCIAERSCKQMQKYTKLACSQLICISFCGTISLAHILQFTLGTQASCDLLRIQTTWNVDYSRLHGSMWLIRTSLKHALLTVICPEKKYGQRKREGVLTRRQLSIALMSMVSEQWWKARSSFHPESLLHLAHSCHCLRLCRRKLSL